MTDPDYQTWLRHLFDHPEDRPEWLFEPDHEFLRISPRALTAHVLRLFEAPALLMSHYSDGQIASGLQYLINNACGGDIRLICHPEVAQADRLEFAARVDRVYWQIFGARCAPALGHLSEGADQPLNMLCYMWWDTITLDRIGDDRLDAEFDAALIEAMGRTLQIPHAACQEGALHGLGHWGGRAPERARALIDAWLAGNRAARPELKNYALAARGGCVQ
jgi:hypothetical protein